MKLREGVAGEAAPPGLVVDQGQVLLHLLLLVAAPLYTLLKLCEGHQRSSPSHRGLGTILLFSEKH